ncbi:MAG TPA: UPF0147 family protein [Candidatus Nanoarchaeia archaeon]|nr:UPF0147 family protein [Candidatus Nanoarchaeia archaeon]
MSDALQQVLIALQELNEDSTTPKNVKLKVENTIKLLNANAELSIKVSKALNELEVVADDSSVQTHTRTQIFNIVSLLELV